MIPVCKMKAFIEGLGWKSILSRESKCPHPAPCCNDFPSCLPPKLAAFIWTRSTIITGEENHSLAPGKGKNRKEQESPLSAFELVNTCFNLISQTIPRGFFITRANVLAQTIDF